MTDFFNLRGAAVFRVLSLISTVALWLTILLFAIGLMMGFFGEQETKAIGWAMVGFSISSFISCLFMFGFCYLIKVANIFMEAQGFEDNIAFRHKGYKGTMKYDEASSLYKGMVIGTDKTYQEKTETEAEFAFQAIVDDLNEQKWN